MSGLSVDKIQLENSERARLFRVSIGRARDSHEQRSYASFHAGNLRKIIDVKLGERQF